MVLTLKAPIAIKVVCFSRLLKCLRSLYGKQCGPRSDCSYRSSLFWVHTVCLCTYFISNARQLFAADDFSRLHFQMHFFLGALRVNKHTIQFSNTTEKKKNNNKKQHRSFSGNKQEHIFHNLFNKFNNLGEHDTEFGMKILRFCYIQ